VASPTIFLSLLESYWHSQRPIEFEADYTGHDLVLLWRGAKVPGAKWHGTFQIINIPLCTPLCKYP
jgi:hypothetical protein